MIQKNSLLEVADNSGAKTVLCIGMYKGKTCASVGDVVSVSVRTVVPRGKVVKGKVYKAVVVRTKKAIRRGDSSVLRFSSNAVVLINDQGEPLGTRVFGSVKKLSQGSFMKIMSLAVEVL